MLAADSSTFLCGWLDLGNTKTALQELAACSLADKAKSVQHFMLAACSDCTRIRRQLHDSELQFLVISYTSTKAATGRCSVEASSSSVGLQLADYDYGSAKDTIFKS